MNSVIPNWSNSALTSFLSNPLSFKKGYILKIFDDQKSVTAAIGKAGHKALEAMYGGESEADAIAIGLAYLNGLTNMEIDFGKTGTRQNMLDTYGRAIKFYIEEVEYPYNILGIEESITVEVKRPDGIPLPLPLKAVVDLIEETKLGELIIIDHKFTASFTDDSDGVSFNKWLQAMFNYHTVKEKYGKAPSRMIFKECKTSKNRDGSPQVRDYVIEFGGRGFDQELAVFYELIEASTKMVNNPDMMFLPNPNDTFSGNASFEVFRQGIIDLGAPVEKMHRTEIKKYVDRKYVPSQIDMVENNNITPEEKIRLKLQEFNIVVDMQKTHVGASVTQYTFKPSQGVAMKRVAQMDDDIALALGAESVRIEAPIKGTTLVGVEVPSISRKKIDLVDNHLKPGTFNIPIGVDVYGEVHYKDITDAPHMLVAGSTGSGKSVMLNVILQSLTKQLSPDELKLVLIDPKQVELAAYEDLPHLYMPVVTDPADATEALDNIVGIMESRYATLKEAGVRSIDDYKGNMPRIVVVVDEFADLMMMADNKKQQVEASMKQIAEGIVEFSKMEFNPATIDMDLVQSRLSRDEELKAQQKEHREAFTHLFDAIKSYAISTTPPAEHSIIRIAQKARAVGIHLILATQRPSADVVTGLIKANVPTKIAFTTSTAVNSRIILDQTGAEALTGKGDMLFQDPSSNRLIRLQALYA